MKRNSNTTNIAKGCRYSGFSFARLMVPFLLIVVVGAVTAGCASTCGSHGERITEIDGLFGRPTLGVAQHDRPPSNDVASVSQAEIESVLRVLAECEYSRKSRLVGDHADEHKAETFPTPVGSPYVWESSSGTVVLYVGRSAKGDFRVAETSRPFELIVLPNDGIRIRDLLSRDRDGRQNSGD
jgi:hypothetical protein